MASLGGSRKSLKGDLLNQRNRRARGANEIAKEWRAEQYETDKIMDQLKNMDPKSKEALELRCRGATMLVESLSKNYKEDEEAMAYIDKGLKEDGGTPLWLVLKEHKDFKSQYCEKNVKTKRPSIKKK